MVTPIVPQHAADCWAWRWSKVIAGMGALMLSLLTTSGWSQTPTPKTTAKKSDLLDVLDELETKAGDAWWNAQWKLRRKVVLEGPGIAAIQAGVAYFKELDPLLLFNTGRCQDGFADLRVVTRKGEVLPSGVLGFGKDDGSCQIWCVLRDEDRAIPAPTFYVYYANPKATPEKPPLPGRLQPPDDAGIYAWLGPEETAPGSKPVEPPPICAFFNSTLAVEAESFRMTNGAMPPGLVTSSKDASAGSMLNLNVTQGMTLPLALEATASLPSPGRWRIHVRFQNGIGKQAHEPFTLAIAGQEFICGTRREPNARFRWESFDAELPSGPLKLTLRLGGPAAPDCVLLSKDPAYRPDCRDVTGPVMMRFKALGEPDQPYYIDWYCVHTPYSERGPRGDSACFLFGDRGTRTRGNAMPLAKDAANLAHFNHWTAWGRSLHSRAETWFSEVRLLTGDPLRPKPIRNARVALQVATRPDASRIFHESVEELSPTGTIRVRMPTGLDQASLIKIEGFGEWGRRRFEMAQQLGFQPNEGPRKLLAATMVHGLETRTDLDFFLKTCNWLGLNTTCLHFHDDALLAELAEKYQMIGSLAHPFAYLFDPAGDTKPTPDKSYAETARAIIAEKADQYYAKWASRSKTWNGSHLLYGILGDEIGPAASSLQINKEPFYKGLFVEFLKRHRLEPAFFGAVNWEEVTAIDYIVESNVKIAQALDRQRLIEETERNVQQLSDRDPAAPGAAKPDEIADVLKDIAGAKPTIAASVLDPKFEKRRCHWTQKFRSEYTCLFYRECTDAIKRHAPPGFRCSVNLQAMPAQAGQMWDGGLNIFDLARLRGFDSLYTEDWTGGTYNVAFAMNLLRAAARKHHQDTGSYVVGHQPAGRVLANLAQGARTLVFYLYGPVHMIGPVWGEHSETLQDIGEALRLAARVENDLLSAVNRPADVAILVANTSEINHRYFPYDFGRDRIATYLALADAQMPVDIVGEEEILEDNALSRYRALYVCDPHVDSRVQQQIKEWVAGGGTLWASYAAMGRQEYDEPSTRLDEVFGLKSRGPLEPAPTDQAKSPSAKITVKAGDLLPGSDFKGSYCRPKYDLSTGQALAKFDDGSPAILHNHFGKGQAFLNAFQSQIFSLHDAKLIPIATSAARAANARRHVRASVPQLYTSVHDGPEQTVVFLFNDSATDTKELLLEVVLPKPAITAASSRSGALALTRQGDSAVVPISLPPRTGDIVLFRY